MLLKNRYSIFFHSEFQSRQSNVFNLDHIHSIITVNGLCFSVFFFFVFQIYSKRNEKSIMNDFRRSRHLVRFFLFVIMAPNAPPTVERNVNISLLLNLKFSLSFFALVKLNIFEQRQWPQINSSYTFSRCSSFRCLCERFHFFSSKGNLLLPYEYGLKFSCWLLRYVSPVLRRCYSILFI